MLCALKLCVIAAICSRKFFLQPKPLQKYLHPLSPTSVLSRELHQVAMELSLAGASEASVLKAAALRVWAARCCGVAADSADIELLESEVPEMIRIH